MASGPSGVPLQKTASVGPGWGTSQLSKVGRAVFRQQCFVLLFVDVAKQSVMEDQQAGCITHQSEHI